MVKMLGAQTSAARKVPTIQGWCKDDGAMFVSAYIDSGEGAYNMDVDTYHKYWDRFRGSGFVDDRKEFFNENDYEAVG